MKQRLIWGEVPEIAEAVFIGDARIRVVPIPTIGLSGLSQSMQITRGQGSPADIPEEIT